MPTALSLPCHLSTYYDYPVKAPRKKCFIKRVITNVTHWAEPELCPDNNHHHHFSMPQAALAGSTTYGGPGSKYTNINEDSFFFGTNADDALIAGVIDGAGGTEYGYLGGRLANHTLSKQLQRGKTMKEAFAIADLVVMASAGGGYAMGVAIEISPGLHIEMGNKGDARAITIRGGRILQQGTTKIHSHVAKYIEKGINPGHAIHTSPQKHIVYSCIGENKYPYYGTRFFGRPGDIIVMGSDGLFDVVSDYEILCLADHSNARDLHQELRTLAYERNNSKSDFKLFFSPKETHIIPAHYIQGQKRRGDNITIQVIELR
ncbi:MAG: hypothetical protein HQM16_03055 [Deltaproteobacteria bacterium]|nr:hypothetical protein [Deltaproteobacteria bacterium]